MNLVKHVIASTAAKFGYEIHRRHSHISFSYRYASKFLYFKRIFDIISSLEGDIVECGVGLGRTLSMFSFLVKAEMKGRKIWGFDSFEGFPEPSPEDRDSSKESKLRNVRKGQNKASEITVRKFLRNTITDLKGRPDTEFINSQIILVKGFFDESLSKYKGKQIALLHADVDLYKSYLTVLETMYPKVVKGGVIIFDEYGCKKFPGAQKAIDEFFKGKKDTSYEFLRDEVTGKFYVVKKE